MKFLTPARMVAVSFAAAIGLGTLLVRLPGFASAGSLSWTDALFMATSAICVTGLTVVDLSREVTHQGQWIMLALIQIGGLGIMTFSVFFLVIARRRPSLRDQFSLGYAPHQRGGMVRWARLLGFVFLMTLSFELVGAVLLSGQMRGMVPAGAEWFYALFHAVSAFCNAGFSLFPDSLSRFGRNLPVMGTMMGLIFCGGIGFMVIEEIRAWGFARWRGRPIRLSLHSRVCLSWSLGLVAVGVAAVWALERSNLLLGMPGWEQGLRALFLSVTSRTAGFNTLPTGDLTNATLQVVMLLMFIGGCPGSTAGGIKVTTFAVIGALIRAQMNGAESASMFQRRIPRETVARALAIFAVAFVLVNAVVLGFQVFEQSGIPHRLASGNFLDLSFEIFSALGTVGLSTGMTAGLSDLGKLWITLLMFCGRIGPLTLALALVEARRRRAHYEYTEEVIDVG